MNPQSSQKPGKPKPLTINRKALKEHRWMINRRIQIEAEMFYSLAYQSLNKSSLMVLHRFLQKRSWDKKTKKYIKEALYLTHGEAEALGISKSQFMRSIKELIAKGFIKLTHQGGNYGPGRDYSRYLIIDDWVRWGHPDFEPRQKKKCAYNGAFDEINKARSRGISESNTKAV